MVFSGTVTDEALAKEAQLQDRHDPVRQPFILGRMLETATGERLVLSRYNIAPALLQLRV